MHSAYFQVLGDHGFIGLALFLLMFFLGFRNCRRVVRECSKLEDLQWLVYLARMLEVGFIGFAVGAAALSAAYYDVFLVLIVVASQVKDFSRRQIAVSNESSTGYASRGYAVASGS